MVVGLNKFKEAFADYPYYVGKLAGACFENFAYLC